MTANDVAIIIGAICGGFALITGPAISIATFIRTIRIENAGKKRDVQMAVVVRATSDTTQKLNAVVQAGVVADQKMDVLHDLTNGKSEELKAAVEKIAFRAGGDAERENPTGPRE